MMKNETTTVPIGNVIYVYSIEEELTKTVDATAMAWKNTLRVHIEGAEKDDLEVCFLAKDDYYMGNTLSKEIVPELNLHFPNIIQQIIEWALQNGWQAEKTSLRLDNGMDILRQLGLEVDSIDASKKSSYHEFLLEEE